MKIPSKFAIPMASLPQMRVTSSVFIYCFGFLAGITSIFGEVPLQKQLNERAAQSKSSPENRLIMSRHLDNVSGSGIYEKALKVGDQAPDFTLKNHLGKPESLSSHLEKGPVILTWYRGGW